MVFCRLLLPCFDGLPRNSENQVEIQIRESSLPQNVKRTLGLSRRMNATEPIQHLRIPGLDSHADAIHSEIAQHLRLFQGYRGRIHLERPFAQAGKIEAPMESGEKKLQLLHRKGGRGATSKKNGFNPATRALPGDVDRDPAGPNRGKPESCCGPKPLYKSCSTDKPSDKKECGHRDDAIPWSPQFRFGFA